MILQRARVEEEKKDIINELNNVERERDNLKIEIQKKSEAEREEAAYLLYKTVEFTSSSLMSISRFLQKISVFSNDENFIKNNNHRERIQNSMSDIFMGILKNLRLMFEGDSRKLDTTTYPHNYFKAAIFEKVEKDNKILLHRKYYHYPEGVEPHKETELVDIEKYKRCAHVLAYETEKIVILEDIVSEISKHEEEARWLNIRHNQSADYKSMVCVPIVRGERGKSSREVLGVLVIDTNREKYFIENNQQYLAFLGRIFSPFRTLLSIALQFDKYKDKFL